MIVRTVFLKLRDRAERDRVAAAARAELPRIPGVSAVQVGRPADAGAEVWDLMLQVSFARLDDVAAYLAHPTHEAFARAHLDPTVEVKKAWNWEL